MLELFSNLKEDDLVIIIVDYGNDLIVLGMDYMREYILVIMYSLKFKGGYVLESDIIFSFIGVIIVDNFNVILLEFGKSYLKELK